MCKVKGCQRPQFVGGLCGFHALQGQARPGKRAGAPAHPLARIRIAKAKPAQPQG
jgi:hypothetical protein